MSLNLAAFKLDILKFSSERLCSEQLDFERASTKLVGAEKIRKEESTCRKANIFREKRAPYKSI